MHITTIFIVVVALLINGIQCPGAGGGRKIETKDDHPSTVAETSAFGVVVFVIFLIAICGCILCCLTCCSDGTNKISKENNKDTVRQNDSENVPLQPTSTENVTTEQSSVPSMPLVNTISEKPAVAPNSSKTVVPEKNPFQTGIWAFRYYQYNKWHGPYRLLLTFDHQLWAVNGKGADDVGSFICDGIYSPDTLRLDLTQRYDEDTGNPEENFGHTSTLTLHWSSFRNVFEGQWHVRTPDYTGENQFEMEFKEHTEPLSKSDPIQLTIQVKPT